MKIEKLKSGSYRIRKMYKGVTYTVVTDYKPTQREAIKLLDEEMDKAKVSKVRMTFKTAAESYMDAKKNVLSPSSIRGYSSILRNLSEHFCGMLITDITSLDVQKEINNYSVDRSPKSVSNAHGFISAVIKTFNPNLILNTTLPQKTKNEPYIPTDDDVKKIIQASKGTRYEIPILLAVYGLRRSEICALTPDDINGNIVTINKAKVQDSNGKWIVKKFTKTEESTRKIYLPDKVVEKIKEQGSIYDGDPSRISRFLMEQQGKLGLPHFSLHKLRHYYASMAHSLGIPDQYIMKAGGWKTDNVLKSVYQHAMKDKQEEMQSFAAEYIKDVLMK